MTNRTCAQPDCNRPVQARGMCTTHWSQWYRKQKKYTYTCTQCGKEYQTGRKRQSENTYCSANCQRLWNTENKREQMIKTQQKNWEHKKPAPAMFESVCHQCGNVMESPNKYCSPECRRTASRKARRKTWSPIRLAYETKDIDVLREGLLKKATVTQNGCWEWPSLDKSGYPRVKMNGKRVPLHRTVLEIKQKAPLGSQAAHHTCGNNQCVNPDHLQPVTHSENTAEMLARHSYLKRIRELEDALQELSPDHALLKCIKYA